MGWVTEPANTWSNFAYILAGLLLVKKTPKFGWAAIFLGFSSGIYHASNNYFFQLADFLGMYAVLAWFVLINFARLDWYKKYLSHIYWMGGVFFAIFCTALYFLDIPYQALVFIMILGLIVSELNLKKQKKSDGAKTTFYVAVFFVTLGAITSLSDHKRWFCDPQNHWLQGHALWHCFSATAIFFAARYFEPYYKLLNGQSRLS